ncbi:MAG: type II toxin-antitoxin system HipA family toxin [Candidatus Thiodiazotropha sp. (ex Lucina pensylvanica)]|nr:type II toxin-antitoxin system HipA family toxin [Candidatus Thiodiazotropha sp. (ex Lucina pensylvanica)]
MGRKRKSRALDVYIGTTLVGSYARAPSAATMFRYAPQWLESERAFPISLSLPLSDRIWSGDEANAYFDGLLPDDRTVRDKIASRESADSSGTFDLLAAIGRDCAGALRFVPEGSDPGDPAKMTHRPVTDEEIAERLAALAHNPLGIDTSTDDFRISIAGMQEKTAYLQIKGQWHLPLGATPTSHIFKPAMKEGPSGADFSDTPWNEWFCLNICRDFGLETAQTEVLQFGGKPVIVVERFDRLWKDRVLYRLPQEDLCQALSVPSIRKYEADGGPSILDILNFLNGAESPRKDRLRFMKAQIIFWLLAAIDGHAKNFSIFLTPGGYRLTPLYDVMSSSPYPELSPHKVKLAMAIGDSRQYRIKGILPRHFYQTAKKASIPKEEMDHLFSDIQACLDPAYEKAATLAGEAGMPRHTAETIIDGMRNRARLFDT